MVLHYYLSHTLHFDRYFSRVVLVPFINDAPDIIPDVLSNLLNKAHAAIPCVFKIPRKLAKVDKTKIKSVSSKIDESTRQSSLNRVCT